jgi:hypothetical protein
MPLRRICKPLGIPFGMALASTIKKYWSFLLSNLLARFLTIGKNTPAMLLNTKWVRTQLI